MISKRSCVLARQGLKLIGSQLTWHAEGGLAPSARIDAAEMGNTLQAARSVYDTVP